MTSRPIFIGGLMKSGTSLLRKLVARHPQVFGGLETHWFTPDMVDTWRDPEATRQRWLLQFFDVRESEIAGLRQEAESGVEFFDRFMGYCAGRAGKPRWVEKTPDNVLHIERIRAHWDDAQFIHVIRDPRDVFASWKRNDKGSVDGFIEKANDILAAVGPLAGASTDQYSEIRYEALVLEPTQTTHAVCEFLGEPWSPKLAAYDGDDDDYRRVLDVTGKVSPTAQSLRKPIFTSSVGQWRGTLSETEVERIQRGLRRAFEIWGWE